MTSINTSYSSAKVIDSPIKDKNGGAKPNDAGAVKPADSQPGIAISSLASRLSRASQGFSDATAGLDRAGLASRVQANIDKILYPLDQTHKAAAALAVPQPSDANSAASAQAATAFVEDNTKPNPFAGLSREQLSAISNDESGTFTINERRAAFSQAYKEEQAWRTKVVAQANQEMNETGKQTEFFKNVLAHFYELPLTEQVLYPADYAADLDRKIALDFNYLTGRPEGSASIAKPIFEFPENTG